MRVAIAVAAFLALASPARATFFIGDVGAEEVHLVLPEGATGQVTGASLRPAKHWALVPVHDLWLLTGTRSGNRVTLQEWDASNRQTAAIEARIVPRKYKGEWYEAELLGTWTTGGRTVNVAFGYESSRTPLAHANEVSASLLDRLHGHIRASRWSEAEFDARLACAVDAQECGWTRAIPALAAGRVPAAETHEPWKSLVLERAGRYREALDAARELCHRYSRIGCLFYADLAMRPKVDSREVYHFTCQKRLVRCADYWGANEIALIEAVMRADEAEVTRLLQTRVNVNAGGEGLLPTPLKVAAMRGSLPLATQLLNRGANVNPSGVTGGHLTPLFYAIDSGNEELALVLIRNGADLHPKRYGWQRDEHLLWEAAFKGLGAVVHAMLEMGEPPDEWSVPAGSPLTVAVENRDLAMVKDLLAHGADPEHFSRNSHGTPIDHARRMGQKEMLRLLLAARRPKR